MNISTKQTGLSLLEVLISTLIATLMTGSLSLLIQNTMKANNTLQTHIVAEQEVTNLYELVLAGLVPSSLSPSQLTTTLGCEHAWQHQLKMQLQGDVWILASYAPQQNVQAKPVFELTIRRNPPLS